MDWVTLGLAGATALISIGTIIMKVRSIQSELTDHKQVCRTFREVANRRFDEHTARLNDQEVAHQAIHTSLQFIIAKLDKIDEAIEKRRV